MAHEAGSNGGGNGRAHHVTWTEAMVTDAVHTYVLRRAVRGQKAFWFVALVMLGLFVWLLDNGDRSWVLAMAGVGASLPWLFLAMVWTAHWRNTVGKLRKMPSPEGVVRVSDEGLFIESGLGAGMLSWAGLTDVWERPGYVMAFTSPNQFNVIPTEGLSEAELARLRAIAKA